MCKMVQDDPLLKTVQLIPSELRIKLKFLSTVSTRSNGCGLHLLLRVPPASAPTQSLATLVFVLSLDETELLLKDSGHVYLRLPLPDALPPNFQMPPPLKDLLLPQ